MLGTQGRASCRGDSCPVGLVRCARSARGKHRYRGTVLRIRNTLPLALQKGESKNAFARVDYSELVFFTGEVLLEGRFSGQVQDSSAIASRQSVLRACTGCTVPLQVQFKQGSQPPARSGISFAEHIEGSTAPPGNCSPFLSAL